MESGEEHYEPKVLGEKSTTYEYKNPTPSLLDRFPNPNPSLDYVIGLDAFEFTSLCPITGQPDYGSILIDYVPAGYCVESKSLKLYLMAYRNHGAFHESCINQIASDLIEVLAPRYLRVFGNFNSRGGIAIRPMVERFGREVNQDAIRSLIETYDRLAHKK